MDKKTERLNKFLALQLGISRRQADELIEKGKISINGKAVKLGARFQDTDIIKIGDKVELKSDINGKEYEGKIIGISAGSGSAMSLLPAQNASGNWIKVVQRIPVKIAISKKSIEKNGVLPIGSSMEIDVKLKKSSEQNNDDSNFELLKSRATKMYQVDEDKLNAEIQEIINKNK